MENSICRLLYWAINFKQDREHHPRPLCWLELGRPIDTGGGGMGSGEERRREKMQALDECREGERMKRGEEKEKSRGEDKNEGRESRNR